MTVKRIKPNILSNDFAASRAFYNDIIGLNGGTGLDWILFFGTDQREVQLSVMSLDIKAHTHPVVSIEVANIDEVHDRALAALLIRSARTRRGASDKQVQPLAGLRVAGQE